MSSEISIRRAVADDAAMLAELAARTFVDTYGPTNRADSVAGYVASAFGEAIQAAEIADPANRCLIVEVADATVGFALLTDAPTDDWEPAGARPIRLSRIYVDRSFQGRRIGAALMLRCLDEARSGDHDVLWLGVWENNHAAVDFYRRWGFEMVGETVFVLGEERQRELVMALRL